ncbi:MAG TPA: class I SAM-dependent methyltransferase [Sphingomicrobium sp.]|nr:class I SAM-dependent methyltransferase [Sphingomicrobium sp.]
MPVGPMVRRLFGPHERQISNAYRAIYINLDRFAEALNLWVPDASNILEVGCGEGAVTERLARLYPEAKITGIDISPRLGRLYDGPTDRVSFVRQTVQELAAARPGQYDLVILSDVLHHVPASMHAELLAAIRQALAPGGSFVFKEWERTATPIHWLCYLSDRWLTGDRVRYMTRQELRDRLVATFGRQQIAGELRIGPWRNNLATLVRA